MAKRSKKAEDGSNFKLIRKSNELVEARYRFDIWEMRVFAKTLTMIKSDDADFKTYHLSVGELLRDFDLHTKGDNYQAVKDATEKLMKRVIEVEKETEAGAKWFKTPLIVSAEGFKDPRDGNYISIQFHPNLKPYLLELKARYLVYDIRNLWGLSSVYSVRIYELLKQYEKIGKRRFSVEDLRLILGLTQGEYPLYANFKQKVILKAQRDLEKFTDIKFSFDEQKQNKRVESVVFFIHKNAKQTLLIQEEKEQAVQQKEQVLNSPFFDETIAQVTQWGITATTFRAILIEFGEEKIKKGLVLTQENLRKGKIKDNVGGFFLKAIEEGWESTPSVKSQTEVAKNLKIQTEQEQAAEKLPILEAEFNQVLAEKQAAFNDIIRDLTQADGQLAETAIQKIVSNDMLKLSLEKQIGMDLSQVSYEEWRSHRTLREFVLRQIELMQPQAFNGINKQFDRQIWELREKISQYRAVLNPTSKK